MPQPAGGIDLIGDIHGHADGLLKLLDRLGYIHGKHPDGRKALFLGDIVNRGPENARTLSIVRSMVEDGTATALMGNHEFALIGYSKKVRNRFLRAHNDAHNLYQANFIREFPYGSESYRNAIRFFEKMPIYFKNNDFIAVHACWSPEAARLCRPYLKSDNALKEKAYQVIGPGGDKCVGRAVEILLKGPAYRLPAGVDYVGADGKRGSLSRVFWWHARDRDLPVPDWMDKGDQFAHKLEEHHKIEAYNLRDRFAYEGRKPVFIGHYNLLREPALLAPNVACLNFKYRFMAYRWNEGDKALDPAKLVCL